MSSARATTPPPAAAAAAPAAAGGHGMFAVDTIQAVLLRLRFYRQRARVLTVVLLGLIALIGVNLALAYALVTTPPVVRLFPVDSAGRRLAPPPLRVASVPDEEIRRWAVETVEMLYTTNFVHYRQQWDAALQRFTRAGRESFERQLVRDNILERITRNNLSLTTRLAGDVHLCPPPATYRQDEKSGTWLNPDGAYEWTLLAEFRVEAQRVGAEKDTHVPERTMYLMRVQRESILRSAEGIAMAQVLDLDLSLFQNVGGDPCSALQPILDSLVAAG